MCRGRQPRGRQQQLPVQVQPQRQIPTSFLCHSPTRPVPQPHLVRRARFAQAVPVAQAWVGGPQQHVEHLPISFQRAPRSDHGRILAATQLLGSLSRYPPRHIAAGGTSQRAQQLTCPLARQAQLFRAGEHHADVNPHTQQPRLHTKRYVLIRYARQVHAQPQTTKLLVKYILAGVSGTCLDEV